LPRRLGDDPLTRTKKGTAATVAAVAVDAPSSAPVAPDSGADSATSQPVTQAGPIGVAAQSQRSYNDVFFQRRAEEDSLVIAGQPQQEVTEAPTPQAPEASEISEISEIPEIREVATLPIVQTDRDVAAAAVQVNEVPEAAQEVRPAIVAIPIEAAPEPSAPVAIVAEPVAPVDAAPEAKKEEPMGVPAASQVLNQGGDKPEPEKTGGFFKRLFGKFGK
jgi:hypothetical protein